MNKTKKDKNLLNKVYKKVEDITVRKVENELIIIKNSPENNTKNNCFFSLQDPTSIKIWELMDGRRKVVEIIDRIAILFNKKSGAIKNDIISFIIKLSQDDLLFEKN